MFKIKPKYVNFSHLVGDLKGVEEAGAADLELDVVRVLLYLDTLGILPPGLQKEILDLLDFTWHCETSARVNYQITFLATSVFRYC